MTPEEEVGQAIAQEVRRQMDRPGFMRRILQRPYDQELQQQEEEMARHTPQRNRQGLPPFDQIQQSRDARRRNAGVTESIRLNPLTNTFNLDFNDGITITPSNAREWGTLTSEARTRFLVEERQREVRREAGRRFSHMYQQWHMRNKTVNRLELNTQRTYFSKQKKSIEVELLRAISNGTALNTKTTSFNPEDYTVKLYGHEIAKINKETFHVKQISFPTEIVNVNLFRHRLRQLGIRCLKLSRETRIYLSEEEYKVITPGLTLEIPHYSKLLCLPKRLYERAVIELPSQMIFGFEDNPWTELRAFRKYMREYPFRIFFRQTSAGITFKGTLQIGPIGFSSSTTLEDCKTITNLELKKSRTSAVKEIFKHLEYRLGIALEEYRDKTKKEYANRYFTGGDTTYFNFTTATMATTFVNPITYTVTNNDTVTANTTTVRRTTTRR